MPLKTQLPSEIAETAVNLFNKRYDWDTMVRAVTVRAINLVPKNVCEQLTLEENTEKRASRERLEDVIESLRDRFGKKAVTYGSLLGDLKMPGDGRHLVKMPNLMYR